MPQDRFSSTLQAVVPNFSREAFGARARRKHNGAGAGIASRPGAAQRARPGRGPSARSGTAPGPWAARGSRRGRGNGAAAASSRLGRLCALGPHLEQRVRQVHGAPAAQHGHHHRHRDHRGPRRASAGQPRNLTCPEPFSDRLYCPGGRFRAARRKVAA